MPKHGEKTFPVPVSAEVAADLETICNKSGLIKTHVLRYAIEAALRTLARCDHVRLPIEFKIDPNPSAHEQVAAPPIVPFSNKGSQRGPRRRN